MTESKSNNLVRLAALESVIGLFNVYSRSNTVVILTEMVMMAMWLQMDYGSIVSIPKKRIKTTIL
ncbi:MULTISPECIES: hypothetical protein [Enterobacter cloacae complex]|nr:hypothetical protein [Enterobacter roggenkampii]ELJ5794357.1 hypothetical protein [Enterobacter roggenkampii]KJO33995.1 hypothetical protein SS06_11095 [Enterobacter roggenkampii]KLP39009.1 hypothetical protein ABF73_23025 [Enterobacter roggenkampii]MBT1891199.1 hypothetical protein [Enterobacter roggenkampii]MCE1351139.1 hypothetical protein [Enterobacter roggenkampii]